MIVFRQQNSSEITVGTHLSEGLGASLNRLDVTESIKTHEDPLFHDSDYMIPYTATTNSSQVGCLFGQHGNGLEQVPMDHKASQFLLSATV